ncbi:MAG: 30S ribosomal protein S3 [Candidatus Aenigmarchaeota archaeon]|nr:30S ribosomal protein S3 [Candidatus Aenigmarchaeota archaeon]
MKERIFIQKAKENVGLEEFIRGQFKQAKCGKIEVQHTPIVTRIIIYTTTPGLVIGAGGERIRETTEQLRQKFSIENPQIDVQKIDNPDADPHIVAQNIANALETGVNYKRLGNFYVEKIMEAGAVGCEIVFSGKMSGQRSRKERFTAGYLKKAGDPALKDVIKGFAVANPRLGNIGVTVKIMIRHADIMQRAKKIIESKEAAEEKAKEKPEVAAAESPVAEAARQ